MSTKIYSAWRLAPNEFADFVSHLDDYALLEAARHVRKHLCPTQKLIPAAVESLVANAFSPYRLEPSIDCVARVYPYGRFLYVIAFSDLGLYAFDPPFRNYQYWNNTDHPDDVSRREWRRRGNVWDSVFDHNGHHRTATYDVLSGKNCDDIERVVATAHSAAAWRKHDGTGAFYGAMRAVRDLLARRVKGREKERR